MKNTIREAIIKAYRVKGAGIVKVIRADGRVHRHRVNLARYNRFHKILVTHPGLRIGAFLFHRFEAELESVSGFTASRYLWFPRKPD